MMRRYLWDVIFIILAASVAILLAGTPGAFKAPAPRPAPLSSAAAKSEVKPEKTPGQISDTKAIAKRNIFVSSGSYQDSAQIAVPDNPYVLVGVVREGDGMKALFREYTGKITKAAVGYRMMDGFRVVAAGNPHVVLKRGNEKKVFNIYGTSVLSAAGRESAKPLSDRKPLLVAVLGGAEKKAVFRDAAGNLSILGIRQVLPDGAIIVNIDSRLVRVRDGKTEKELTLHTETLAQSPIRAGQSIQSSPEEQGSQSSVPPRRRPRGKNIQKGADGGRGEGL